MRHLVFASAVLMSVAIANPARADVFTVDPSGNGDFLDLQVAIQSVPAESTLLVQGTHGPVVIDRSLAIIGGVIDWDPFFDFPFAGLEVQDVDWLYLEGMEIGHGDSLPGIGAHGVFAANVEELTLEECIVRGTRYWPDGGGDCFRFGPYHGLLLDNVEMCNATDCQFLGAEGRPMWAFPDGSCSACDDTVIGGDGGDGVHIIESRLWVESCIAKGGSGGDVFWNPVDPSCDFAPTLLKGGDGGNGVTGDVNSTLLTATGGSGGGYWFDFTDWGTGENGADGVPIDGVERVLPDHLEITPLAEPGESVTLSGHNYPAGALVLIYVSGTLNDGADVGKGVWFLNPPWIRIGLFRADGAGNFQLTGDLVNDPSLIGLRVAFQGLAADSISEVVVLQVACTTP